MPTTSEAPGKEQRQSRRYSVTFPCEVKPATESGDRISAQTQDVSSGGLFITVPAQWKVGTAVEFTLHLPLKATGSRPVGLRCQGKVARVVERGEQFGIGATIECFEFIQLDSRESVPGKLKAALARSLQVFRWPPLRYDTYRSLD